ISPRRGLSRQQSISGSASPCSTLTGTQIPRCARRGGRDSHAFNKRTDRPVRLARVWFRAVIDLTGRACQAHPHDLVPWDELARRYRLDAETRITKPVDVVDSIPSNVIFLTERPQPCAGLDNRGILICPVDGDWDQE